MGGLGGEVDQTGAADRPDVPRKLARPENVDFTIDANRRHCRLPPTFMTDGKTSSMEAAAGTVSAAGGTDGVTRSGPRSDKLRSMFSVCV